ncbi:hypothetical protein PLEI_1325 [Photobacterium leiognathi lrivu.4.1]|uniref:TspB protein n=2 Tax=Photobacterium leiognathi TaxID=553611 RepID=V5F5V6_PHOLE|nr:hypothetical protein PLEI_1325 [Photobacterium leiognathi lrivu.4.1]
MPTLKVGDVNSGWLECIYFYDWNPKNHSLGNFRKYQDAPSCPSSHPHDNGDGTCSANEPPPPENQCKMPAGEIIAANIEGVEGSESKFYCIDNCSAKPVKVGGPAGLCITFGDGIKRCTYDLISTGVDCDGTGDGTTDGDGNPTPNPVPDGEAPNDTGTGDGSVSGGDGSLEPDNPNDDDTGGTGDTDGDGEHTTSDTNGNLAKIVENTSNTVDGLQHNTNILSSKLDGIKDAIGNIPGGGGAKPPPSGTDDENNDGVTDNVNGETCETFVCNGSATQCYIAKRLWEDKCGISNLFDTHENNITNTFNMFIEENKIEDIDAGTLDVSKYMNKFNSSNGVNIGGGGCPAPKTISVLDANFTIDLNPFCDLAKIIKAFLLTFASFGVIMMIAKYY